MNIFKMIKDFLTWRKIISTSENYIAYLRKQGVRVGDNCTIYGREDIVVDMTRPWLIEIGDNVEITAKAVILTHGYDWSVFHKKHGSILGSVGKVKVGNNVFIGLGTTLLPGTDIGENVIVGAGSVVKGVLEPNSVYAGFPAKRICSLDDYYEKRKSLQLTEAVFMVNEYIKVYNKQPPIEVMHEHFWLFENSTDNLHPNFIDKLALRGNFEKSSKAFTEHTPMFKNYEEFLKFCNENKETTIF